MRRTHSLLALATVAALSAGTVASAHSSAPVAHASAAAAVDLHSSKLGAILVSSSGRTLYEFTRDHADKDTCVAVSGCAKAWPPLKTSGRPKAGAGVKASLLSSINLPGGGKQVTYAGHPLYLFAGDSGPAETGYVGVRGSGGSWYAINASGNAVR
jgi:predicted lipoprotein with Yx(FWY)xxD motif